MKFEEKVIGPKEAHKLLDGNVLNRNVRKQHLAFITKQMKDGKWRENTGEAIKISKTGNLLDGQHRLRGVINSGQKYKFLVITGLEDEVMKVIDTGAARTGGDILNILGVKNSFAISAIIRHYAQLANGDFTGGRDARSVNSEDIVQLYNDTPDKWQLYANKAAVLYIQFRRRLSQSHIGAWYKFLSEKSPEKTEQFFTKLCYGIDIKTTVDPIGVYRDLLIDLREKRMRQSRYDKNGYFVLAWNAFVTGKQFKKSDWNPTSDPFPEIIHRKKGE